MASPAIYNATIIGADKKSKGKKAPAKETTKKTATNTHKGKRAGTKNS